ncbi:hypothetical protein [Marinobacter sp. OP 3.4]|uniref:hypothetical protein n=1 Tax=Marinobacter sp. OP 3.4 TaxID=3076501 RepID=UPI002E1B53BF
MKTMLMLLIPFAVLACTPVSDSAPDHPDNVPKSAVWVGGTDGGVFVQIDKGNSDYRGVVYAMETGAIWYEGPLEYSGSSAFDLDDPQVYDGWDGDDLYLTDGETLSVPE